MTRSPRSDLSTPIPWPAATHFSPTTGLATSDSEADKRSETKCCRRNLRIGRAAGRDVAEKSPRCSTVDRLRKIYLSSPRAEAREIKDRRAEALSYIRVLHQGREKARAAMTPEMPKLTTARALSESIPPRWSREAEVWAQARRGLVTMSRASDRRLRSARKAKPSLSLAQLLLRLISGNSDHDSVPRRRYVSQEMKWGIDQDRSPAPPTRCRRSPGKEGHTGFIGCRGVE